MVDELQLTQEYLVSLILPLLRQDGVTFSKSKRVWAMQANGGELVVSTVSDGEETRNTANPGDYIVKNDTKAGERYVVEQAKFEERYEFYRADDGCDQHLPKGKVLALEMTASRLTELGLSMEFTFSAPWGELQVCRLGDYMVCPLDYSEVYRIAAQEFNETYKPDAEAK